MNDIKFTYQSREILFDNLNLEIKLGECIGIIGKNGSGKSTLLDLITGIIEPEEGEILVDNKNIKQNVNEWQNKILFMSQNIIYSKTVFYQIYYWVRSHNFDKNKLDFAQKLQI